MAEAGEVHELHEEVSEERGARNLVLIVSLTILALLIIAGAFWLFIWNNSATDLIAGPVERPPAPLQIELDPFTVNVLPDREQIARVTLVAGIETYPQNGSEEKAQEEWQPLNKNPRSLIPAIRDSILDILSTRSGQELTSEEGAKALKKDIMLRLNTEVLRDSRVKEINITDRVVNP